MELPSPYLPFLIGAGAVMIGTIFFFVGRHLRSETRDVRSGLATAGAVIVKKFRRKGGSTWGGLENYFIQARYEVAGVTHEVELHLPSRAWRMLREGRMISVNYPLAQPEQAQFGSVFARNIRRALGMLLLIGGILVPPFFVVSLILESLGHAAR